MTRQQFIDKATRAAERKLLIPFGWWGTWQDVHGPAGQRVRFSRSYWVVSSAHRGVISRHDSRAGAIAKAKRL